MSIETNFLKELSEVLDYNPKTGKFTWLTRVNARASAGQEAGTVSRYRTIGYKRRRLYAHRLAWLYVYGEWPAHNIDHINGDKLDNRIQNLRVCSEGSNNQNRRKDNRNTSGYVGVSWVRSRSMWEAKLYINGKRHTVGLFTDPEEARQAYVEAKIRLHPLYEGRDM